MSSRRFSGRALSSTGPAVNFIDVIPDDELPLEKGVCRGLFVGIAGTLVVADHNDNTVTLHTGGSQYHPLRVARVLATGTSASGIIALY